MTSNERPDLARQRLEHLYEISQLFLSAAGIDEALDEALRVTTRTLPLRTAILVEASAQRSRMVVWALQGADTEPAKAHIRSAFAYLSGAPSAEALQLNEEAEPRTLPELPDAPETAEAERFIVLPLVSSQRKIFGAIQLESHPPLEPTDLHFVNAVANQLGLALDRQIAWEGDAALRQRAIEEARADANAKAATAEQRRTQAVAATERYEALVDHLDHAFVWEADAATVHVAYVSARAETLLGYPRARWRQDESFWMRCVHPDDRAALERMFARARSEKADQRCNHRCISSDGKISWFHTGVHYAQFDAKAPVLQGVSIDITPAKMAEAKIRAQLDFTRAMAASVAEAVVAIDREHEVTFLNRAAEDLIGGTGLRSLARRLETIATREDGAPVECPLYTVMRTGEPVRCEEQLFTARDGTRFPVAYSAAPIRQSGQVTGAVLAFSDISERRRAEDAQRLLIEASRILSESLDYPSALKNLAQLTLPSLGDFCFFDIARPGEPVARVAWAHVDPVMQRALDEAHGRAPGLDVSRELLSRVVRGATPEIVDGEWLNSEGSGEARRSLMGERAPRSTMVVPLRLGRRGIGALSFVFASERSHTQEDLELAEELGRRAALALESGRLYERAQEAVRAREQVLAVVSHDLRNPLGTLMMAARLLDKIVPPEPAGGSARRHVDIIARAASRILRLVDDLLDFASIESGRLSVNLAPQDVGELLQEATTSAREEPVQLVIEVEPDVPAILADRDRILQVLSNLIANAVKVVPPESRIVLRAETREREVVFAVCDTGPGIPKADLPRIFERYWRGDVRYRGTGLGLGIAQGIVAAHGGRIWAESEEGQGATLFFTVPRADQDRGEASATPRTRPEH